MKKRFSQIIPFLLTLLAVFLGVCDATVYGVCTADATALANGGVSVANEPITNEVTEENVPDLLMQEVDKRIVKMRPQSTPLDQISRYSTPLKSGSMEVKYYSVSTRDIKTTLSSAYTEPTGSSGGYATAASKKATLAVENPDIFEISTTIRVAGVKGYDATGTKQTNRDLMLIVIGKEQSTNNPIVVAVNGKSIATSEAATIEGCVPSIPASSTLIRMGRAAAELDAQTAQYSALPTAEVQFCQIFMAQVEQSTFNKIAEKEVDWNFSDIEEEGIYDMRLGMENSYLFGEKGLTYDEVKKANIYTTGGIWWMAGKEFTYGTSAKDLQITEKMLIDLAKETFTGYSGNKKKILLAGSGLIANLSNIEFKNKYVQNFTEVIDMGLVFKKLASNFGDLLVVHDELFDLAGMENNGLIIDQEYVVKATHKSFERSALDLKKAGVRNTDAVVMQEASCLYLKYPKAHVRICPSTAS